MKDERRKTNESVLNPPILILHPSSFILPLLLLHPSPFIIPLLRWAFQRFYREFSWTYDAVAYLVSRGYWQRWTLASLPFLHGRVLETGCGTGYVQLALAQHNQSATGLDASAQMLGHTRRRLQRANRSATLVRAISQQMPFADHSYDSVLATFPTEYIIHPDTLAEIRRVLAPDGRLVVVDAAYFTTDGLYERLVDLAYWLTFQRPVRAPHDDSPPDTADDVRFSRLHEAGFATEVHWIAVDHSRVMVLVSRLG